MNIKYLPKAPKHLKRLSCMSPSWTFFNLPDANVNNIIEFSKLYRKKYKYIVLVGIGGASLGTQAIINALPETKERMLFLDNPDPELWKNVFSEVNPRNTLFLFISKSGETLETTTLSRLIVQKLYSYKISVPKHCLTITENTASTLGNLSADNKIPVFAHPLAIGGRFSVLGSTALLPSAILGININNILKGALSEKKKFLKKTLHSNVSLDLAHYANRHTEAKKNICVLFPYTIKLMKFCEWYAQLIAESLGKKQKGITPLIVSGPKDQHSLLQLFLEGPKDKWFIFFPPPEVDKRYLTRIQRKEMTGVTKTLFLQKTPFIEIATKKLDEETLGKLFFTMELQIAILGSLWGIDPFTQDAVERSKKITLKLISRNK